MTQRGKAATKCRFFATLRMTDFRHDRAISPHLRVIPGSPAGEVRELPHPGRPLCPQGVKAPDGCGGRQIYPRPRTTSVRTKGEATSPAKRSRPAPARPGNKGGEPCGAPLQRINRSLQAFRRRRVRIAKPADLFAVGRGADFGRVKSCQAFIGDCRDRCAPRRTTKNVLDPAVTVGCLPKTARTCARPSLRGPEADKACPRRARPSPRRCPKS